MAVSEAHQKEIADIVKMLEHIRDSLNAIMDDSDEGDDYDPIESALDFLEETLDSLAEFAIVPEDKNNG